ncbi:hypothetical protein Avbf_12156 [Armadillidium vulgare]|nr:hypothetical protein Avbf_12156 [Armadillidium vulgare]
MTWRLWSRNIMFQRKITNIIIKLHVVCRNVFLYTVYLLSIMKRIVLSLKSIIVLKCMISRIISIVTHGLSLRLTYFYYVFDCTEIFACKLEVLVLKLAVAYVDLGLVPVCETFVFVLLSEVVVVVFCKKIKEIFVQLRSLKFKMSSSKGITKVTRKPILPNYAN